MSINLSMYLYASISGFLDCLLDQLTNLSNNIQEEERAYESQRRVRLNEELIRIQKKNFIHFTILCLLPLFLLVLVLVSSFTAKGTCDGYEISSCKFEDRSFMNAFVRRCICTAFTMD